MLQRQALGGTARSRTSFSCLYIVLSLWMASFRGRYSSGVHHRPCFNAFGFSVRLIPGPLAGCSGARELNAKHVLDDLKTSRTGYKPNIVREEPSCIAECSFHESYMGMYVLSSLEREPEVHLSLGTD